MEQGKHKVNVTGAFVGESPEKKTPYIALEFTNGAGSSLIHRLYLSDTVIGGAGKNAGRKVKEVAVEQLVKCGFKARDIDVLATEFNVDEVFQPVKGGIEITVVDEEYSTDTGELKTKKNIKYLNFGFESRESKLERAEVKKVSSKFNLGGDIAKMMKEMSGNYAETQEPLESKKTEVVADNSFAADDIPF